MIYFLCHQRSVNVKINLETKEIDSNLYLWRWYLWRIFIGEEEHLQQYQVNKKGHKSAGTLHSK